MPRLTAGQMKHSIELQKKSSGVEQGFPSGTWVTKLKARCAVEHMGSKEGNEGERNTSDTVIVFRLRWRSAVDSSWRVKFRNQFYEIVGEPVNVNYENWEMQITGRLVK